MPLVSRGLSCFSISLKRSVFSPSSCWRRASASIAERPGVGLHAAASPAGALGAAALDDHVADLPGGAAAEPRLAVEDQPAADAGAPEDADQAVELAPGAEVELGFGRDLDVVADPDLGPQAFFECLAEREAALPVGQVAGAGDDAGLLVGVAGGADPDALAASAVSTPAASAASRSASAIAAATSCGPAAGRRRPPRFALDLARGVDDRGLDLGAAEVDAAAQVSHGAQSMRSR